MGRKLAQLSDDSYAAATPHSTLLNHNVTVAGHRTSIRLEPAMWQALHQVCEREHVGLHALVTEIAENRLESSLTAAIRVYLLSYFRVAATDEGHRRAGHGNPPLDFRRAL